MEKRRARDPTIPIEEHPPTSPVGAPDGAGSPQDAPCFDIVAASGRRSAPPRAHLDREGPTEEEGHRLPVEADPYLPDAPLEVLRVARAEDLDFLPVDEGSDR